MRDVFPSGPFRQNYPLRFLELFVTSVTARHAVHAAESRWRLLGAMMWRGEAVLGGGGWGGGEMKAEIDEVNATALLPGHRPEEAVCGRPHARVFRGRRARGPR